MIVNKENFATEIVRTMIGSIGLVLAVPITTLISVFMLEHFKGVSYDKKKAGHHTHSH